MPTMYKLMSCADGHFWETAENGTSSTCPVCGGAPDSLPLIATGADEPTDSEDVPVAEIVAEPAALPVIPGYEILEERGRSSAGIRLFLAKQELVPRKVLLKVVKAAEDRGQRAWGALRGEAGALGKLSHANIVQLFEAGERGREIFYNAVEFVDGPTLAQNWSSKPLPYRQAAALVVLLARAVQHAHSQGIVHRCLRPGAIQLQLYKSEGPDTSVVAPYCLVHSMRCIPKISDYGLARRPVEGDVNDLDLQQGPPSYLSPEQVWGRAKDIGPATDIYALGAVLCELVRGAPPFVGSSLSDTLDMIQSRRPPALERRRPGMPRDLAAICLKCLEKQPRHRYRTADALADDLQRYLDGRAVKARPIGFFQLLGRATLRAPVASALLCCVAFLGIALAASRMPRPHQQPDLPPEVVAALARPKVVVLPPPPPPSDFVGAYGRSLALAERAFAAGDAAHASKILDRCSPGYREWEWYTIRQKVNGDDFPSAPALPKPIRVMAMSPSGQLIATVEAGGDDDSSLVLVSDMKGHYYYRGILRNTQCTALTWDNSSNAILALDRSGRTANIDCRERPEMRNVAPLVNVRLDLRAFSSHQIACMAERGNGGDYLACLVENGRLLVYDRSRNPADLGESEENITSLACAPEKNYLAAGYADGSVRIWDIATRKCVHSLEGHMREVTAIAFSPGATRMVSSSRDGSLCAWDPREGREIVRLPLSGLVPSALSFHPDGRHLCVATDRIITIWGGDPR